jgi:hypothetical protein
MLQQAHLHPTTAQKFKDRKVGVSTEPISLTMKLTVLEIKFTSKPSFTRIALPNDLLRPIYYLIFFFLQLYINLERNMHSFIYFAEHFSLYLAQN